MGSINSIINSTCQGIAAIAAARRNDPDAAPLTPSLSCMLATSMLRYLHKPCQIPEDEVQKELRNMCEKYGEIVEITVKSRAGSDHTYAFVQFKNYDDAEKAVQKYDF